MATSPQPGPGLRGIPASTSTYYHPVVQQQQPPMPLPPPGFTWNFGEASPPRVRAHGVVVVLVLAVFSLLLFVALIFLYSRWARRYRHMARSPSGSGSAAGLSDYGTSGEPATPGPVKEKGLTKEEIGRYPVVRVSGKSAAGTGGGEELQCSICLGGLTEVMKVLPVCGHGFHTECVDLWLGLHASCPLCRASLRLDPLQAV